MTYLTFREHVVWNLLRSPFFSFRKVLLLNSYRNDQKMLSALKENKINHSFLSQEEFDRYRFDKNNHGLAVFIEKYFYTDLKELLKRKPKNKFRLFLILDGINDPQNLGSILRTAAALNIDGLIIGERNQALVNETVIKVSSGGVAYVSVCKVSSLGNTLQKLLEENFLIASTVCDPNSDIYSKFRPTQDVCLIFGNEHSGVRPSLIRKSFISLYIPVHNEMNSLNVVVSCAIICSCIVSEWTNLH